MVSFVVLTLLSVSPSTAANPCQPLASTLLDYIRVSLPGYQLARTADFEKSWLSNKIATDQTDGVPWCISGDFDGNGQTDVVLILKYKGEIAVMGFRRVGVSYAHSRAFSRRTGMPYRSPLQLAVFRTPPGRIIGGGFGDAPVTDMKNTNPGVTIQFFETSSVYLYWSNGRWHEVWTSD